MATLTRGITFGSTEQVTNTKLHNLVDLGAVSQIVDADCSNSMNLSDNKLAMITTVNKVSGAAVGFLPSIPSGAGLLPISNFPTHSSSYVSFYSGASIPNNAIQPIALPSYVDGGAMKNLASIPSAAGTLNYYSVVSSLASGAGVIYDGSNRLVGAPSSGIKFVSTTSISAAANTGDVAINPAKNYKVVIQLHSLSVADIYWMRFNNSSNSNYKYAFVGRNSNGTAITGNGAAQNQFVISGTVTQSFSENQFNAEFNIFIQGSDSTPQPSFTAISGTANYFDSSTFMTVISFAGRDQVAANTPITSFRILTAAGATFSGSITLYELGV